jgi:hypothetical protein
MSTLRLLACICTWAVFFPALAVETIEAVEPKVLCERFLDQVQKTACLKTISEVRPDSYLAAICDKQDDHEAFYNCIRLSENFEFDPRKIQSCSDPAMKDDTRITCLQQVGQVWTKPANDHRPAGDRQPAHVTKKKPQRKRMPQRSSR